MYPTRSNEVCIGHHHTLFCLDYQEQPLRFVDLQVGVGEEKSGADLLPPASYGCLAVLLNPSPASTPNDDASPYFFLLMPCTDEAGKFPPYSDGVE